ncbi:MAG: hypothetical protein COA96_15245 [SAR86 cluster bacterium]|uniref:Uncharacterized protein n=1 Tax=SAR86 cluster bacterium TaxID=2030880 RepID=A0A2A5AR83_9GAMM|nr:MAG: hypothetical protein COA96_15245 [SAR86 cluster bacterium]
MDVEELKKYEAAGLVPLDIIFGSNDMQQNKMHAHLFGVSHFLDDRISLDDANKIIEQMQAGR